VLSPRNRLSDSQNWQTVELVLEGIVFLTMGLQIKSIVTSVNNDHAGVGTGLLSALGALVLTVLIRAAYVGPLLAFLGLRRKRIAVMQPRMETIQEKMSTSEGRQQTLESLNNRGRKHTEQDLKRFSTRITRGLADIEYFLRAPLGWRDGVAVVWAGMRGAVTVAAAQTLPEDTPQRSLLVLVAFIVAALSLGVQGATIGPLLRALGGKSDQAAADETRRSEQDRLFELMRHSSDSVEKAEDDPEASRQERFDAAKTYRLAVLNAQRAALLDARDNGVFDADVLENALANLDAEQMSIELRGKLAS
jgi:CPA1 family monovalent cation:H+ antiporter